jgi:hypothetical protein
MSTCGNSSGIHRLGISNPASLIFWSHPICRSISAFSLALDLPVEAKEGRMSNRMVDDFLIEELFY